MYKTVNAALITSSSSSVNSCHHNLFLSFALGHISAALTKCQCSDVHQHVLRPLRSAARSQREPASRLTSRCTTLTLTSSAWETPACGRRLSCPAPSTCSSPPWPCPSSRHSSHSVKRRPTVLLKYFSIKRDNQHRAETLF